MPENTDRTSLPNSQSGCNREPDGKQKNNQAGFVPTGYKSRLDALMAVIRFGPELLSDVGFKVLLFHTERSVAYGKASDAVSLKWMTNGIRKRGGGWLRGGSGLSKSGNEKGNRELVDLGLITRRERHREKDGGLDSTEYTVRWEAVAAFFEARLAELEAAHTANTPAYQKSKPPCSPQKQTLPTTKAGNRESSSELNSLRVQSSETVTPKQPCKPAQHAQPEQGKGDPPAEHPKQTAFEPFSLKGDDATSKPTEHPGTATTDVEAKQKIKALIERGKERDPENTLNKIGRQIRDFGDGAWVEYCDRAYRTAAPEKVAGGFYVDLAKQMKTERQASALAFRMELSQAIHQAATPERVREIADCCPRCRWERGSGFILDQAKNDIVPCPDCATPDFIAEYEVKQRERAARKAQWAQAKAAAQVQEEKRSEGAAAA